MRDSWIEAGLGRHEHIMQNLVRTGGTDSRSRPDPYRQQYVNEFAKKMHWKPRQKTREIDCFSKIETDRFYWKPKKDYSVTISFRRLFILLVKEGYS